MCHNTNGKGKPQAGLNLVEEDQAWVGTIGQELGTAWFVQVSILGETIKMKVDTGAQANVVPLQVWKRFKKKPGLQQSTTTLRSVDNRIIESEGTVYTTMSTGERSTSDKIFVTRNGSQAILGLKTSVALGLVTPGKNGENLQIQEVTANSVREELSDIFTGLGQYPDVYHIQLKEGAEPVIQPPRRVPNILFEDLKKKLQEMQDSEVICPVDEPTKWVNSLVIAKKADGSLRLCLDPKDLNKCIERERFEIPTFEQIVSNLGGKSIFTTLDQKDSYWQVTLDRESSLLTTFNTPFGRYRFLRMPFGISSASEVLQKNTYRVFGDIENVYCLSDDMLIATASEEEHDMTIKKVMERARKYGVKFNPKKIQMKQTETTYMGRKISAGGIKPDPRKVEAVLKMPQPQDVQGVQRLLGVVNFMSPFIPNMSTITAPLRDLLKKEVPWHWSHEHTLAFTKLKEILSSEPVLKLYDSSKPTTIQCDSSSTGLGACLLQDEQPIAYASRALTESEKRYAQIEKELLSIVFAAEHFHQYIYGQEVKVQSDHKPLETIVKKPLQKASPRLQTMLLRLLRYKLTIKYTPGTKMYIADTLSRAYQKSYTVKKEFEEDSLRIHCTTMSIPATNEKLEQIRKETKTDQVLKLVLEHIRNDHWPDASYQDETELKNFRTIADELYIENGIIFHGERMVIPKCLREETLNNLHKGHLGIEKCKTKARQSIFWPRMGAEIENKIKNCEVCEKFQREKTKEPMISHEIPKQPWKKLGADIFELHGKEYLVVVDYFSKYPEVARLRGKGSLAVIEVIKPIFARQGIPDEMVADNNPFASREMAQFAKEWNFKITTSSPRYPQSNGQAERFVNIVKTIMRKCNEDGSDPNVGLLHYRNSPVTGMDFSPAQLLMGRQLKDLVLQQPKKCHTKSDHAWMQLKAQQTKAKSYYDRSSKTSEPFRAGQPVKVLKDKRWEKNTILQHAGTPRSYIVQDEDGRILRRTSRVIRPSKHKPIMRQTLTHADDPEEEESESHQTSRSGNGHLSGQSPSARPLVDAHQNPVSSPTVKQEVRHETPGPEARTTLGATPQTNASTYTTRSGRIVKQPIRYTL